MLSSSLTFWLKKPAAQSIVQRDDAPASKSCQQVLTPLSDDYMVDVQDNAAKQIVRLCGLST